MNDNYATAWESIADRLGDRLAVVQGERRLSWVDLDQRAARLATALERRGVGPGATVGLLTWNCPEYLEATYAAFKLASTPVNLNYRYGAQELAHVLDYADVRALVFHARLGPVVQEAIRCQSEPPALVQVDDGSPSVPGAFRYEEVLAGAAPRPRQPLSGDALFMVCTGGTTGRPKGVLWRHSDLASWLAFLTYGVAGQHLPRDAAAAAQVAGQARTSGTAPVTLAACPLVHGTAFFFSIAALVSGGSVVLLTDRSFRAEEMWAAATREKVTQLVLVGDAMARPGLDALDRAAAAGQPYDLSSLARVFSSGLVWSSPVKSGLGRHCRATMIDMLGSSEGGPFAIDQVSPGQSSVTGRFKLTERGSVLGQDGDPVRPGQVGRLAIVEPLPVGYHRDPAGTAATFPTYRGQRYAVPGDLARLEDDETVTLLGRGSDCINTGGEKVYPDEVEDALKADPAVADCVVIGVEDGRWGEMVAAVVALVPGREVDVEALRAGVRGRLAGYKVPRRVVLVPCIERKLAGKPDYQWARAVVTAGTEWPVPLG